MTLKQFIKVHRVELDVAIALMLNMEENPHPNDEERRQWVMNDEGLYN
ncbi:hypothetical protein LCGC14_3166260 [marine sediment metagenome]|uniref:Uncharacterized protein n=1 Tax=marine sediment metagenome TaxID=412755 RepID=A0A0F8Y9U5_9ZZZZ